MTEMFSTDVGGADVFPVDLEVLETIADWREDLTRRVRRARLQYELIGLSPEEVIGFSAEVESLGQTCAALRGEWGA